MVVDRKLQVNRSVSADHARRVDSLTTRSRLRLEQPDDYVDPKRDFNTLSYLHARDPRTHR